ncbi:phosphate transport system substrate-binding protein [Pseudomonas cuatrocienegasensis]|uniref:Phosphate transport system substrate-binding protein n=1 Tax=Pseudomonas cuatrocienegasensis TaxID=543360 RepID=A0ABY1BL04_9PSED|nr:MULTISPECIES: phosphate ABC transporter substrate-binding/OmpA family protein [Pseudomonas]OEC32792.1 hypothetical protein A7D25_22235 [Pseudomonas sp. 21C1]SER07307.1 phosphate transport system substrate-binding protein [Pseudomonas cuatrocienegasensis]
MSRESSTEHETWSRTLVFLLLGFICYALPWSVFAALEPPAGGGTALRIQGSNTIGAELAPALVKGLLAAEGYSAIEVSAGDSENEQRIRARSATGKALLIEIAAHGSSTGFTALAAGQADLAASSRPIKDSEAQTLATLGDLRSPAAEQIIALDGLAIIVHPDNPLTALSSEQLASLFAGETRNWAEVGGTAGPITVYARDDQSGTYDTFKELVLAAHGKSLSSSALRFESSEQLSDAVSRDPQSIGFIGLPYVRRAKPLAVSAGDAAALPAEAVLIATEDYPLSRRLFLYAVPTGKSPWTEALLRFAHSSAGQAIVERTGFIAQTLRTVPMQVDAGMPADYQALVRNAQRLSVNIRFQPGSAELDNKAQRDLTRLVEHLQTLGKGGDEVVLVGFGDAKADPARAELLSRLRAMAVRRELARAEVYVQQVLGMGAELPVAANDASAGRLRNRRVEVWLQ